ncbi:MAG: DUF1992 domain-containing protein [Burkholderiales bacterium]|nr:DUF1992 domain-containing protein [Burkholderiales bacterium]
MSSTPPGFDLGAIAEERIQAAIRRGELDNLPGAGKPLVLDDDLLVPEEARVANRILKNAGFVPVEVTERREIALLAASIPGIRDDAERARAIQKLAVLELRLGARRSLALGRNERYREKVLAKLGG